MLIEPKSRLDPQRRVAANDTNAALAVEKRFRWVTGSSLLVLAVAFFCAATTALFTFPIIEGWYETLIFLEKHGHRPYVDAEFVLPPMTILLYRIYDFIGHSQFAITKLLGLTLTLVNCGLLYWWLSRRIAKPAALLSSVITFVILTTEPLYAASDYHDLVQFFVTLAVMFGLSSTLYLDTVRPTFALAIAAALGAIAQALFLTKQNIGLGVSLAIGLVFAARLIVAVIRQQRSGAGFIAAQIAAYIASFLAAGFLILTLAGINDSYYRFIHYLLGIQSKGSAFFAATRLLHDSNNFTELLPGFELAVAIIFLYLVGRYLFDLYRSGLLTVVSIIGDRIPSRYFQIVKALAIAAVTIYVFKNALEQVGAQDPIWLYNFWPTIFTVTAYLIDLFTTVSLLFGMPGIPWIRSSAWVGVSRVVIFGAVFYSNSLTASMNVLPVIVMFCFYFGHFIDIVFRFAARQSLIWFRSFLFGMAAVVAIFVFRLELGKLQIPYSWWGLQEAPVFASSVELHLPYMDGLRFDPDRALQLQTVVDEIQKNTAQSDPILTFPDIPVFYMLSNRLPMTKTYVQWFDFSTNASLIPDFMKVSSAPPKIIVQLTTPQWVSRGHEGLLGRALPQQSFADYLNCMISNGAFDNITQFYYSQSDELNGTFRIKSTQPISATQVEQIAISTHTISSTEAVVTGALGLDDSPVPLAQVEAQVDRQSTQFGGFTIQGKGQDLPTLLKRLQQAVKLDLTPYDDAYVVRVLKRQPAWESKGAACKTALQQVLQTF